MSIKLFPEQIRNYIAFEDVRKRGHYNMHDSRARQITGMSKEEYAFVIENYEALARAHHEAEDKHIMEQAELHQPG